MRLYAILLELLFYQEMPPMLQIAPCMDERTRRAAETRLYRTLQNSYGLMREHIVEAVEISAPLPSVFWRREEQALASALPPPLLPLLQMGVRAGLLGYEARKPALKDCVSAAAQEHTERLTRQIMDTLRERVEAIVSDWIDEGEPLGALRRRLWAGPLNDRQAEFMAETETTRLICAGQLLVWRLMRPPTMPLTRYVVGKRWRVHPDDMHPFCQRLDGRTVALDEPFAGGIDHAPAHPRCRCTLEPVWSD
jgi:hypothetical protein